MKRKTVLAVIGLVSAMQGQLEFVRRMVDEEALTTGDRNVIDHTVGTMSGEIAVLAKTLAEMLDDPTRVERDD